MDAEKIVENMKAVLKKAKRRKSCLKNKSQEASNNEEDKLISELMTKNWKMKTPPINKNKEDNECDNGIVKQKVNAFEKLMSRRSNTDSPSQKVITTPETIIDSGKKAKRKYTKKIKNSLNVSGIEFDKTISADNSIQETQNSVCNVDTDEILPQLEEIENVSSNIIDSTKKRTRINDTALENSSKKRKTRDNRMQLDSNENTIENTENHLSERPKRSCVNKIDYSLFAKSPEKSPEKRNQRAKSTSKTSSKHSDSILDSPVVEPKENIKLAPLFTKKAQKFTPEITPKKEELKVPENKLLISPEKPVELNDDINKSGRPRRSCVSKIDYSQLVSPDKKSPEKKPLRQKSETENIILSPVKIEEPIIKKEEDSSLAPVFVKRSRKQNLKNQIKIDDTALDKTPDSKNAVEENNNANQPETTPSGRPKRSCKSRIDYSQLYSPDKQSPDKKINNGKSKKKDDDDIIIVDESSPVKKTKQNVKLAPLFMKKVPKPAIDPAILEARRNFLLSELPANLRATIDKQRQFEEDILSNEMVAFPKISHITQLEKDYKACYDDKTLNSKSRIRIIENDDEDSPTITKDMVMKCGLLTDCINEDYNNSVIKYNGLKKEESKAITDIKEAVRKIKDTSGTFPVNRCFKQILSKLKSAKENDEGNENGNSYLNSSFVEIFKPTNFEEILIGLEPVKSLQEFLNTWNDKSVKYDNYESDDSSSRQSMRSLNNCVVLSGKNGSGKTSSVYALANDLNYEVIEINAGLKRNGKKILQDLLEATQSHRVEKNLMDDESSLDNLQSDVVDKKTIILIEDAELTFENDDGFISSIQQLINISKRPVILTTNDSSCQHLQKFLQHNEIIYDSPKNSVTKYLSLISIATANYQIDETEIEYLYTHNRYDLRKTINEIEFFIRSESANVNSGSLMELFCDTRNKNRLQKGSQLAFHSRRDLSTLRSQSSIISDYSAMLSCSQQVLESSEISYHQHNLMNEMANFFKQSNLLKMDNRNDFAQWEPHRIISSSISDEMCSLNSSTRAKNVDYSPLLRHICRSEKSREISRRTSRSHYLRFHLSNAVNSSNEFFNTQCSIFEEANGENV